MNAASSLLIYGAGGFAREVAWLAEECTPPRQVVAFIDDNHDGSERRVNDIAVGELEALARAHPAASFVVAVGDPATREAIVKRSHAAGLVAASLIHRRVERSRFLTIGEGSIVCAGSILTTNVVLGRHVHVNLDCTVGHDAVLDDYVTLAPGVHISGNVHVERGAYLGTGACVINGAPGRPLRIGAWATVGAGAVVTREVPAGVTVVGVPARART